MKKQIFLIGWIAAIAIGIFVALVPINIQNDLFQFETTNYEEGVRRAAIIDQLYYDFPDKNLHKQFTEYLKNGGYEAVDIYTTPEVTVDFYRNLPSMNYDFILIRTHSLGPDAVEYSASLFTGEIYDPHKYVKEQFLGNVARGIPYLYEEVLERGGWRELEDKMYFSLGKNFVDEEMIGKFPGSTIILAGCETMKESFLADAFLKRGASEVIGWSDLIGNVNNDEVLIHVLNQTLNNDVPMKDAVYWLNDQVNGELDYNATLMYISNGDSDMTSSYSSRLNDDAKGPSKGPSKDGPNL